jgi:hypothetical protein
MRFRFYKLRTSQTIKQTSTTVPNKPYPNIIASTEANPRIHNTDEPFCTVGIAMYVRFGTQSEQFVGYPPFYFEDLSEGFIFLDRWLLVAFPDSLNSPKRRGFQFNPSGPLVGTALQEMKQRYETERDKEFESHVCAAHPREKKSSF